MSITREPESAEVTKKTATRAMARVEVIAVPGRYSKKWKRAVDRSVCTASEMAPAATPRSRLMAELPKTVIHRKVKAEGTSNTPIRNSRTVRPREMRAMNMPTNGDQAIHQAQ
ncbi:hypothetical protein D3C80_1759840 [compost metagenome]